MTRTAIALRFLLFAAATPALAAKPARHAPPPPAPAPVASPLAADCDAQRKAVEALSAPPPKVKGRAPPPARTTVLSFQMLIGPPGKTQPLLVQETKAPATGDNTVTATFTGTAPPYFAQINSAGACILDPDGNIDISSYDSIDVNIVLTVNPSLSASWATPEENAARGARVDDGETLPPAKISHGMWPWNVAKYSPRLSSDSDILSLTLPKDANSNRFELVLSYIDPSGAIKDLDALILSH